LPRPGRRDLIEQRGDRGVIGAGPWPEPAGQWWRTCQSLGPSSRSFAGSIPSAGRTACPAHSMFCVSAFKNRQPRILARPPLRSRVATGGRGHVPHPDAMEVVRRKLPDQSQPVSTEPAADPSIQVDGLGWGGRSRGPVASCPDLEKGRLRCDSVTGRHPLPGRTPIGGEALRRIPRA
jgi:hypothetical protein